MSFAVNLAILFFYKYFDFTVDNLNVIRGWMGLAPVTPGFDVLLPVGISFYIFQALSYVVDVYRGDVRMETNFIKGMRRSSASSRSWLPGQLSVRPTS